MQNIYHYETRIGIIGIVANDRAVTRLFFDGESCQEDYSDNETALIREAGSQLQKYLAGELTVFSVPLHPTGTPYLLSVWNRLRAIPYGQTCSYLEIARDLGNRKAARAVGLANNKNPIPIFIPCHRVIGSDGKLTGFRGGLPVKKLLLEMECRHRCGGV